MANEWMITADDLLSATTPVNAPARERAPAITFDDIVQPPRPGSWDEPASGSWGAPIRTPEDSRAMPVFKANLVEDPETKIRLAAQSLFPGDPDGMNRLGIIGGRLVKVADDGSLEYVADKWGEFGAGIAANAPEIVAGTVGSLASSPVIGSTLGVMGARGMKRAGAGLLFDEPQTVGANLVEIGKEGAVNAAVAGVGKTVATAANRGRVVDFTPQNLAQAKVVQAQVKSKFGIDLNLAQASQDPRLLQMWRYLARYPGKSAEIAEVAQTLQEGQVDDAVVKFLDLVGKGYPSATLGKEAIDLSKQTIAAARKQLSDEVDPLYKAAYKAVPVVDRTTKEGAEILDYLKLPYFRQAFAAGQKLRSLETKSAAAPRTQAVESLVKSDEAAGTWAKATTVVDSTETGAKRITSRLEEGSRQQTPDGLLTRTQRTSDVDITRPSLEELDYTKRALDAQIEDLYSAGQRQRARALKDARDEFVAKLDALPNSEWQAARAAYQAGMKSTVEPLEKGVVGILAGIKDPKAATAAIRVFRDPNVGPREILQAKGAILAQPGGKEAWDGLVRQWLGRSWDTANRITQKGEIANPAGKFVQNVAGTPSQEATLKAALGAERGETAGELIDTLRRVASSRVEGSDTAFNQELTRMFGGPMARFLRIISQPLETIRSEADRKAIQDMTARVAEALTDTAKTAQLRTALRMPDSTRKWFVISAVLMGESAQAAASDPTANRMPPSATPPPPQ